MRGPGQGGALFGVGRLFRSVLGGLALLAVAGLAGSTLSGCGGGARLAQPQGRSSSSSTPRYGEAPVVSTVPGPPAESRVDTAAAPVPPGPPAPPVGSPTRTGAVGSAQPTAWGGYLPEGALAIAAQPVVPTRLRIPELGIDAAVVDVRVLADGALDLPADVGRVGWYGGGPAPGQSGSAVLAAHVDYQGAPGVFLQLGTLRAGTQILIERSDASVVAFRSLGPARSYRKSSLPIDQLFRRGQAPELTLITCGGAFDPATRSYQDNVVVSAVPSAGAAPGATSTASTISP